LGGRNSEAEAPAGAANLHWKPSTTVRVPDAARVEIGRNGTAGCVASLDGRSNALAQGLSLFGPAMPD
jgi:hypothetical protein